MPLVRHPTAKENKLASLNVTVTRKTELEILAEI
jgi:hypothetical protein